MYIFLIGLFALLVSSQNPFSGKQFYVNPSYQEELDTSIATASGTIKSTLQAMRSVASAYWIDVMAKISGPGTKTVEGILKDASTKNDLVVFIVYDLPNRDCHAKASNGEICCTSNADGTCDYNAGGDCADGIKKYQQSYIDPLVKVFKEYPNVPIIAVIEPDSLPNLATNQADPHCGNSATQAAYKTGIPYAINQIATCSNVHMYLDAAHGGWLGWPNNLQSFTQTVNGMGILNKIRGFSTNVANYQPIGLACPSVGYCLNGQHQSDPCCADPCRLSSQYNPAHNEMNYVMALQQSFPGKNFIVDSGRNGVPNMRSDCANWCNIRNAGVGLRPTINTNSSGVIDAFYWLKTPGESDGCTQELPNPPGGQCARFDSFCGSADSIGSQSGEPRAPVAGNWFDYQVKQLAQNAHMSP
jgi:cellulose 1,4-beta-cellobiosidase